jgi:hypothetical protein
MLCAIGLHLRVGPARADEEEVGERGKAADVEQQEVVRLLVEGVADAEERGLAGIGRWLLQETARLR